MRISKCVREHVMAISTVIGVVDWSVDVDKKRRFGGRVNSHFFFLEKESSRADSFLYIDQEYLWGYMMLHERLVRETSPVKREGGVCRTMVGHSITTAGGTCVQAFLRRG